MGRFAYLLALTIKEKHSWWVTRCVPWMIYGIHFLEKKGEPLHCHYFFAIWLDRHQGPLFDSTNVIRTNDRNKWSRKDGVL